MNGKNILVADSGGTGTEWCYVDSNGMKTFFSGRSFHPLYWSDQFIEEEKIFWSSRKTMLEAELSFFGAGCLDEANANKMKQILFSIGFIKVLVRSDLHAAAFSVLNDQSGTFGIIGTGSVAAQFENGIIFNVSGGLGYILGDEGSGYYFGKLLIQKLLNGRLNRELTNQLHQLLGDKSTILQNAYGQDGRKYLSGLSLSTQGIEPVVIDQIHEENIEQFFQSISGKLDLSNGISFVGSYAYYKKDLLMKIARKSGIIVNQILEKPIEELTEYIMNHTK